MCRTWAARELRRTGVSTTDTIREARAIVTAHSQTEGGGFVVRRPLPTHGFDMADPFLLLDEMGPATYGPGQAVGAPDHPHRPGIQLGNRLP